MGQGEEKNPIDNNLQTFADRFKKIRLCVASVSKPAWIQHNENSVTGLCQV